MTCNSTSWRNSLLAIITFFVYFYCDNYATFYCKINSAIKQFKKYILESIAIVINHNFLRIRRHVNLKIQFFVLLRVTVLNSPQKFPQIERVTV
ncbi:hypothetical protein MiSe_15040 [Microseira wollei NIES-4236]|uniref:Transposase n=1 Tax=Microseira wollei NIES-4236 TaxID=2530354 RepID=A0AAV3X1X3_9CYAN|nr:hypothetical protein MiSe_15040 [Microseira wollei NIES-4236]